MRPALQDFVILSYPHTEQEADQQNDILEKLRCLVTNHSNPDDEVVDAKTLEQKVASMLEDDAFKLKIVALVASADVPMELHDMGLQSMAKLAQHRGDLSKQTTPCGILKIAAEIVFSIVGDDVVHELMPEVLEIECGLEQCAALVEITQGRSKNNLLERNAA